MYTLTVCSICHFVYWYKGKSVPCYVFYNGKKESLPNCFRLSCLANEQSCGIWTSHKTVHRLWARWYTITQFPALGFKWEKQYTYSWKKNYNLKQQNGCCLMTPMYQSYSHKRTYHSTDSSHCACNSNTSCSDWGWVYLQFKQRYRD